MANICYKKKEFCICFKISKDATLTIDYYRCGSNKEPYFSTTPTTRPRPTVADVPSWASTRSGTPSTSTTSTANS